MSGLQTIVLKYPGCELVSLCISPVETAKWKSWLQQSHVQQMDSRGQGTRGWAKSLQNGGFFGFLAFLSSVLYQSHIWTVLVSVFHINSYTLNQMCTPCVGICLAGGENR